MSRGSNLALVSSRILSLLFSIIPSLYVRAYDYIGPVFS